MTESVSDLVAKLGPMQSTQARTILWVLAYMSDERGDCGVIPLKELARLTQVPAGSVPKILNDLEDLYGLVQKTEQGPSEPSAFRLRLDRLSSPHAHLKQDVTTFKAVYGPLAGEQFPVPDIPEAVRRAIVSNPAGKSNAPLIYRSIRSTFSPVCMTQQVDGVRHVYRLSTRTWQYAGTSVDALIAYGASRTTVNRLQDADVLTMEELGHKIALWKRRAQCSEPEPETFGPALLRMTAAAHELSAADPKALQVGGARTVLAGHRTWVENQQSAGQDHK